MRVIWTRTALSGIASAHQYLMLFNPTAAIRLAEALLAQGLALAHFPHRGRLVPHTQMREIVVIHPYVMRYRIVDGTVVILRIRHAARRPTLP